MKALDTLELLLLITIAALILNAVFTIVSLIFMKRASDSVRNFIRDTRDNVNTVLSASRPTIENMRKISSDLREVTADIRQVSHAIADAEEAVRDRLVSLDQSLSSAIEANVAGLKAGVAAGVASLVRNSATRKECCHERRSQNK